MSMALPDITSKDARIAAIDIGTNSFHMVVASVSEHGVMQIHARNKDMVRLGSSATDMKRLSDDAMDRGVQALARFAAEARRHNASIRAIATSAVREALNKEEFVRRVYDVAGIHVDVIPGIEEGRLIYTGVVHALPVRNERVFVIDIGGGSTETVIGQSGEPLFIDSTKLGHLRLTKRFFPDQSITSSQVRECRDMIRGEWATVFQSHRQLGFQRVIGCSGTVTAIASMVAARRGRIPESYNGFVMTSEEVLGIVDQLVNASTLQDRLKLAGMDPKRADVIVAGGLILEQAILGLDIDEITVSGYALREGIVFDTVQQQREMDLRHHLTPLRYQSVQHVSDLYRVRRRHADHVKTLSVRLFDQLIPLHNMGDRERELLEAAALLHDVGYHISADQHHKHSEYIIRNSAMPGFTSNETNLIASIARYHRKSHPKKKHTGFAAMSSDEQHVVQVLSSILRIAEGLDRRLQSVVRDIHVTIREAEIIVGLQPATIVPDIELWGAERRKELMEETFGRKLRFFLQ
jgi:exopolyphosphatase/guanosine-5'-triphosphate,3'-diphosphate pyrophosphatase